MIVDFSKTSGPVKIMHAVNNGPHRKKPDQTRDNYDSYKALKIPYARNHDASFDWDYGGSHTVDVNYIFQNFDAPVDDPTSYDFVLTDDYVNRTFDAGTEMFYRLGAKIEHEIKKYNTLPPKDFQKWAQICEHIIAHYTEGWDNGFHYHMTYWEIWNEADGAGDDAEYYMHKCWGGTEAEFFRFFEIVAKHLKSRFPHLKIGGPAACCVSPWTERFLQYMSAHDVPLDFFSWHGYYVDPAYYDRDAKLAKKQLANAGYDQTESILNEWNYVAGWTDQFIYTVKTIIGMKGAAFTAATMSWGQSCKEMDMLMYYDARPCVFNGLWDFYTMRELKGYYPFQFYSALYQMGQYVPVDTGRNDLYAVAATDGQGKCAMMLTSYTNEDNDVKRRPVTIKVQGTNASLAKVTMVDEKHFADTHEVKVENGTLRLNLPSLAVYYIEFQ